MNNKTPGVDMTYWPSVLMFVVAAVLLAGLIAGEVGL